MPPKKVTAMVKLQCPAGQVNPTARRSSPWVSTDQHHGLLQTV